MSGYYAENPHYAPVDFSEERKRRERAEQEASRWFAGATKPQKAAWDQAIADLRGLPFSAPRYQRAYAAAERRWNDTTAAARELLEETIQELMRDGEVSEGLAYRWELLDFADAMQAAE